MAIIIGIGGVSMAGKSTLALAIKSWYPDRKVRILCQDDFVYKEEKLPKINGLTDWESPKSINFDEYIAYILARSTDRDIVIAEGLLAFADSSLSKLYHKKIFIEIDEKIFKSRKAKDIRWGQEPDWYVEHIWKSHQKFGFLPENEENVLILNESNSDHHQKVKDYLLK